METLVNFIEKYKTLLQAMAWFLFMIVVPTAIWFTGIDYKFKDVYSIIMEKDKKITSLELRMTFLENKLSDKLEVIHKDLGEIKGELKRLR